MSPNSVIATYRFTPPAGTSLERFAEGIAVGQTLGTPKLPNDAAKAYLAEVLSVVSLGQGEYGETGRAKIAFPLATVVSDIGVLLTVLFGKISMAGIIRLEAIEVSPALLAAYGGGPSFGLEGLRQKTGVAANQPLLMSIFKPCLGLSSDELGELYAQQCRAGVDMVKDDEVLSDPDFETARRRLSACRSAGQKAVDRGDASKLPLYATLLSGPADQLLQRARTLVADGVHALLFNYLSYGLPMLQALRQDAEINVPLFAHPALGGAFYGSPDHGIAPSVLFGTLPRLAGADAVLFPSPYGSVCLPQADALEIAQTLKQPLAGSEFKASAPVPSAGIVADMAPRILADFGTDVVINAGTGIHDFSGGAIAGVQAFRQGILDFIGV